MAQEPTATEEGLHEVLAPRDAFRIALPNFEGPLDLLLHLIREHRLDILDIPIALIAEKYLAHLEAMKAIDLDIAGEFLVMASTLLHLKSRMLLPREEQAQAVQSQGALAPEASDPRAELVRRLLDYQKYKYAAQQLALNDLLDRDVFPRRVRVEEVPLDDGEVGLQEVSVYRLIEALDRVLEKLIPKMQHEVVREHLSLSQAMLNIAELVRAATEPLTFEGLFVASAVRRRGDLIITFLALLELCKMKLLRATQLLDSDVITITAQGDPTVTLSRERLAPNLAQESDEYR
jgi:segregation and condensation protein A